MTQICIFPIPNCVTFPGTLFPLHVFEPRYRQMINHCLEQGMPVAICHTEKELSPAKPTEDLRKALESNQATYKPYPVFSAGICTLRERMEDGRLLVDVDIQQRYRMGEVVQLLPYQIYECTPFNDRVASEEESKECAVLREKITHRLNALLPPSSEAAERLKETLHSAEWLNKSDEAFSFELFGLIRFNAEFLQTILEMDSPKDRLSEALRLLNS